MQHGVLSSIHRGLFQGLVIQGIITGPARTFKSATAFRIRGRGFAPSENKTAAPESGAAVETFTTIGVNSTPVTPVRR